MVMQAAHPTHHIDEDVHELGGARAGALSPRVEGLAGHVVGDEVEVAAPEVRPSAHGAQMGQAGVAGVGQEDRALVTHASVHLPLLQGLLDLERLLGELRRRTHRHLQGEELAFQLHLEGVAEVAGAQRLDNAVRAHHVPGLEVVGVKSVRAHGGRSLSPASGGRIDALRYERLPRSVLLGWAKPTEPPTSSRVKHQEREDEQGQDRSRWR